MADSEADISQSIDHHQLLSAALSNLVEGVMITDNNLERPGPLILYVNPALCRMCGYNRQELINQSPRILQGAATDRSKLACIKEQLASGKSCTVELVNYRKDGQRYEVELFLAPIFNTQTECTHYLSLVRQLTARKTPLDQAHTDQAHIPSHQLKSVLDTAVDAIVTIDQQGTIVSANRATVNMFGYTLDELLGENVKILMPEPFRREHDQYIRNYLETGHPRIIGIGRELTAVRKDGVLFPIDLAVTEVDNSGLFTGIIRDLTVRRALQQQVLELASEQQRRIGFHLQEGIGQDLTGIHLLSSTLASLFSALTTDASIARSPVVVPEHEFNHMQMVASRLVWGIGEAIKNLSQLAFGVMPVQLDSAGLRTALQQLCHKITGETGIPCRLHCQPTLQIENHTVAAQLYRIVEEAVAQAITRNGVTQVELHIQAESEELVMQVIDDAQHCESTACTAQLLSGQRSADLMRYRAGIIGAALQVIRLSVVGHAVIVRLHQHTLAQSETSENS